MGPTGLIQPVFFRVCATHTLLVRRRGEDCSRLWVWEVSSLCEVEHHRWLLSNPRRCSVGLLRCNLSQASPRKRHIFAGDFGLGNTLMHMILKSWFVKISGRSKYTYTDISLLRRTCFCCQKSWMICVYRKIYTFYVIMMMIIVLVLVLPSPKEVTSRIAKASLLIPSNTGGTNLQQLRSWLLWLVHLLW